MASRKQTSQIGLIAAAEVFSEFDIDDSGYLGFKEMSEALRKLWDQAGLKPRPDFDTLEAQFHEADSDGDNQVDLAEFVKWYSHAIEWTHRLKESEAHRKKDAEAAAAGKLDKDDSKVLFHSKRSQKWSHAEAEKLKRSSAAPPGPFSISLTAGPPAAADGAAASRQRLNALLDLVNVPSYSDREQRRVRATKRSVKKEDLMYASAKWYGRVVRPSGTALPPPAGASPHAGAPTKKQLKLNGKVAALATVGIADPGLV